jgi:hypothetical protein
MKMIRDLLALGSMLSGAIALNLIALLIAYWGSLEQMLGFQGADHVLWVAPWLAIGGIVCGHVARYREQRTVLRWLALAGLLAGYSGVAIYTLTMTFVVFFLKS